MCGIAGLFSVAREIGPQDIKLLSDCLKHRGPDDEGYLAYSQKSGRVSLLSGPDSQVKARDISGFDATANLYLGHRRLSIIDLSPLGHQPMGSPRGDFWIILNGEIYNYLQLRRQLRAQGYEFLSQSDTEVLLAAYEEWGEACLDRLDGMWSFVIFDKQRNILFGARDRFGVKPFYYFHDRDAFAFASEIKALIKLPFLERRINAAAAFEFLALNWIERNASTLFQGIHELQPGHAFRFDLATNQLAIRAYYKLAYANAWEPYQPQKAREYAAKVQGLLFDAVSSRLQSDVPVGSCLSGGLDSSAVVCIVNQILEKESLSQIGLRQKVFTVGYPGGWHGDEIKWARIVAEKTKTDWYRVILKAEDIVPVLEDVVYTQDIPFSSASIIAQYFLMRKAHEAGIKVLMDGQGGDELFAGYDGIYLSAFRDRIKHWAFSDALRELMAIRNSSVDGWYLLRAFSKIYAPHLFPLDILEKILRRTRRDVHYLQPDFFKEHKDLLNMYRERRIGSLNETLYRAITSHEFKCLLRYEDRNAMKFSIEARTPLADHQNLIEEIFQIPGSYKIRGGWSKALLRQALKDILPEEIRWRRDKLGFATPEALWLKAMREAIREMFSADEDHYLDIKAIRTDMETMVEKPHFQDYNPFLWRAFIFRVWRKTFRI